MLFLDSERSSIPVTFKGPNGATTIPVRFEPSVEDKPLKLHFESDGKDDETPAAAFNLVASQLKNTNTSITATATQLTNLVRLTSNSNSDGLLNRLSDVTAGVRDLTRAFNAAVVAETAVSTEQGNALAAKLKLVAQTESIPYQHRVAKLWPNSVQSVEIPLIDPIEGGTGFARITLCTHEIDSAPQVALAIINESSHTTCDHASYKSTHVGGEVETDDGLWIATVNYVEHHWYGNQSATVTLSPGQSRKSAATTAQRRSGE